MDSQACNYNPEATLDNNSCEYALQGYDCDGNEIPHIGDQQLGGIVFYIDETGMHGLVAAIWDWAGIYEWGCYGTSISGADGQSIGTGLENTIAIIASCSETNTAAYECSNAVIDGYSDWYLPSAYELSEMWGNIFLGSTTFNQGNFWGNVIYWSSSEFDSFTPWYVYFTPEHGFPQAWHSKNSSFYVRPIRSF